MYCVLVSKCFYITLLESKQLSEQSTCNLSHFTEAVEKQWIWESKEVKYCLVLVLGFSQSHSGLRRLNYLGVSVLS